MVTLLGANILSTIWTPVQQHPKPESLYANNSIIESSHDIDMNHAQKCNIDFGCDDNLCWRRCNRNDGENKLWCYTSPNRNEYQRCVYSADCSICWECIESCHV